MKPTIDFIKTISEQAGEILLSFVGEEMGVRHKSRRDLVTLADHAAEAYLIDTIRKAFPDHAINAEESGELEGAVAHRWFIDPLDGTLNFAHGLPIYCVSVAYAYQGEIELGVVYDPVRNEFFSAERGGGAWLNGQPIHVSEREDLIECMLATGFPGDDWGSVGDNMENFNQISQEVQTVRRLGSAALDIVYVAAGRLDGFWSIKIHQWDVAAGGLIVREAGGVVTDMYSDADYMKTPVTFVCANPVIQPKMLAMLAGVRQNNP